jgi:aldose 1-epimerase
LAHVLAPRPGYPFTVSLAVEYALSERGLSVRTTATNTGSDACPFGSGQHPYLTLGTPSVDSLVLSAPGGTVLIEDERGIPRGRELVDGTPYDFRRPREIGATTLDDAFCDWCAPGRTGARRAQDRTCRPQPLGGRATGICSSSPAFAGVSRRSIAVSR